MIVSNKYKLLERIGQGEFGTIFKAESVRTGKLIAIKRELDTSPGKLLQKETNIYQCLQGEKGFLSVLWYGHFENHYYMALPLLRGSLTDLKHGCGYAQLSLTNIAHWGMQMMERLKVLHSKGLIHRDVKPDNFLFGTNEHNETLYLIDYGFCKKYTSNNGKHIPLRNCRSIVGTPNFISISIHEGWEPSRRDDLESVAYIMYYLWCQRFPHTFSKEKKIEKMRENTTPLGLKEFWNYCRNIAFDEDPNYEQLYNILQNMV